MTTPNIKPEDVKRLITKDENGLYKCPFCNSSASGLYGIANCKNECIGTLRGEPGVLTVEWNTRAYVPAILTLLRLLDEAGEALGTCRVFAGCELEYDTQRVEDALTAIQPYRGLGKEGV